MINYLHQLLEKKDERSTTVKLIQQSWTMVNCFIVQIPITSPFPDSTEVLAVISIKSPNRQTGVMSPVSPFPFQ